MFPSLECQEKYDLQRLMSRIFSIVKQLSPPSRQTLVMRAKSKLLTFDYSFLWTRI